MKYQKSLSKIVKDLKKRYKSRATFPSESGSFPVLDMINWQCFLNLAMEIGQCFRIVSLETGQCFLFVSLKPDNVMIENIALFSRTWFVSVALFPWPNSGSVASLSCPKLGNIATFWRKCSTRLVPVFEFLTYFESDFQNFIYQSWIRKHSSAKYQKLVNRFRVPLRFINHIYF